MKINLNRATALMFLAIIAVTLTIAGVQFGGWEFFMILVCTFFIWLLGVHDNNKGGDDNDN